MVVMYLKREEILKLGISLLSLRPTEGVFHVWKPYLPSPGCWSRLQQTTTTTRLLTAHDFPVAELVPSARSLQSAWEIDITLIITQILFNYSCYKCFKGKSAEAMGADRDDGEGRHS